MGTIYEIRHVSGKRYIGSAVNLKARWALHRHHLSRGKHHSSKLQRAWNKYGEDGFSLTALMECEDADLLYYEQLALDTFKPWYNCSPTAGSTLGIKHTDRARANMRQAARERSARPEWQANHKAARALIPKGTLGRNLQNPEVRAKAQETRRRPEVRAVLVEKARARAEKHQVFGESLSVLEACEKYGMPKGLVKNRLKFMSLEEAVTRPVDTVRTAAGAPKYAHEGKLLSLAELAVALGVSKTTARRRVKAGGFQIVEQ